MTERAAIKTLEYLMRRGGKVAIDTETTGLNRMRDRVLYWSMATDVDRFFFPVELLGVFDPLFARKDVTWRLANAKYDMHLLKNMGTTLAGQVWDIIDMDAMVDDTRPHGLKDQAWQAYEARWGDFKELFLDPTYVAESMGLDKRALTRFKKMSVGDKLELAFAENPDLVIQYATCDAYFTYYRAEDLETQLAGLETPTEVVPQISTQLDYYKLIEVPLTRALWHMERQGWAINEDHRKSVETPIREGLAGIQSKAHKIVQPFGFAEDFKLTSTDTLRTILYSKECFNLKPPKFNTGAKTGKVSASTDEKALNILLERLDPQSTPSKFIQLKLEHAALQKSLGTYVVGLEKHLHKGKIHCKVNQSGARTSRFSTSEPNLQNIPVHHDPYNLRGLFISDPGTSLIDLDYPQIEFRVAAAVSRALGMIADINRGWDIHSANGARMYAKDARVTYDNIMAAKHRKDTKADLLLDDKFLLSIRQAAKTVGLAVMYGEGDNKMAIQLGCSKEQARKYREAFFDASPEIAQCIRDMHRYGHETETTYTLLGRVRQLYGINSWKAGMVAQDERRALNTLMQGTAAELMKLAILRVHYDKDFNSLGGKLVMTVHDELVGQAPDDTAKDVAEIMKDRMGKPFLWGGMNYDLGVDITPDYGIAKSWDKAK
jgi:DNA polymerase-1